MRCHTCGLGSSPVARHYWGNHCYFLFLEVLRCFSSLRSPHYYNVMIITLQVIGLSHSEIPGSRVICTYPGLIAAYHVLHRLREPRHPPSALIYFLLAIVHTFSCHAQRIPFRQRGTAKSYCCSIQLRINYIPNFLQSCLCQYVKERCALCSASEKCKVKSEESLHPPYCSLFTVHLPHYGEALRGE